MAKIKEKLTIGNLAKASGIGVEAVRFYQREGLIQEPQKPTRGYREYSIDTISKIKFIKRCQELGFSLREIKEIIAFNSKQGSTCSEVRKKTIKKLEEINEKIENLKQMKKSLEELKCACDKGKSALSKCDVTKCFDLKGGCCEKD
ncbi:MAG: MerR family DNA-binding protein [Oligoflexia bacterium]|nr:MerR family DNA-binding protein [Oligoflexia bacterium]